MQPWLAARPIEPGSLVPWMPTPLFVERDPHHAHRITGSRPKQMKIAAPPPALEHFLVVTESGHLRDASYFPFADGRSRMRGANRDWVCSDKLIALKHPEHIDFRVDLNDDRR